MNVTKLKAWKELEKLGFTPVNFRFRGKVVSVGAAKDGITIQPTNHKLRSSKRNYLISGNVKTPYLETLHRYTDSGRKEEVIQRTSHVINYFSAGEILPQIQKMIN